MKTQRRCEELLYPISRNIDIAYVNRGYDSVQYDLSENIHSGNGFWSIGPFVFTITLHNKLKRVGSKYENRNHS